MAALISASFRISRGTWLRIRGVLLGFETKQESVYDRNDFEFEEEYL